MSLSRQILILLAILVGIGLVSVYSASYAVSLSRLQTPFFYLWRQFLFLLVGISGLLVAYAVNPKILKSFSLLFLVATLVLVAMTFLSPWGVAYGGAHRWLEFGVLGGSATVIPAEFLKIAAILYFAAILSKTERPRVSREFLPLFFWLGLIAFLLLRQPSAGALAIISFALIAMYLLAGARFRVIFLLSLLAGALLLLIVGTAEYRLQRFLTFLNPETDTQGASYQLVQAKIAVGSGGIIGRGFGRSESKYVLPEPFSDAIFAIYSEETGFFGSAGLVLLYFLIVVKLFTAALRSGEKFYRLFIMGFALLFAVQAAMNMGAIVGLLPLSGIPLPFMSYGGSSLVSFLIGFGIVFGMLRHGSAQKSYSM